MSYTLLLRPSLLSVHSLSEQEGIISRFSEATMKWLLLSAIVIGVWYPVLSDNYDSSISGLANEEALKSGRESHDSVSRNSAQTKYCRKPATCEKLKNSTCFGVRLPYTSTSLDYIPDVENQMMYR